MRVNPVDSAVKYNPKVDELILIMDLKFQFNVELSIFEIDQNPFGEPSMVSIGNIQVNDDFSNLKFKTNYQNRDVDFELVADTIRDKKIVEFLTTFDPQKYDSRDDLDKLELIFHKGKIEKIYVYKYKNYELLDSIAIVRDESKLFLIRQNPFSKELLKSLHFSEDKIIFELESKTFTYLFDLQPLIFNLVKDLIFH